MSAKRTKGTVVRGRQRVYFGSAARSIVRSVRNGVPFQTAAICAGVGANAVDCFVRRVEVLKAAQKSLVASNGPELSDKDCAMLRFAAEVERAEVECCEDALATVEKAAVDNQRAAAWLRGFRARQSR